MSGAISLTAGMRGALNSLGDLQSQITSTNNRLATGRKVNTALDNAVNYFTAQGLRDRAKGLSVIQDNIKLGINVLKQADKGLNAIKTSLEQAEGTLKAALNATGQNAKSTSNFAFRTTSGTADANAIFADTAGTATNRFQTGEAFSVRLATVTSTGSVNTIATGATITLSATVTVQYVIDQINTNATLNPDQNNRQVEAYLNDAGNLVIESKRAGADNSGNTYALQFVANTGAATPQGNIEQIFNFSGVTGGAPSTTGTTQTQTTLITGASTVQAQRNAAATSFREVLNQIRNQSLDSSYNGTNLLNGDTLITYFNEGNSTSLSSRGSRTDASSLGLRQDNFVSASGDSIYNFQSDREILTALGKIKAAKETVVAQQSAFATNYNILLNRDDYTKTLVSNLNEGADTLTLADLNEEGANLTALQTRQQMGVIALSLANAADQAILRLF